MSRLRVGVVGVGHLGQHHARILAKIEGVELVGVSDARPEQARVIAERVGTRAVEDYRALVGGVDAVSIAVPTALHREVAGTFLSNGIATMVEKPLAASLAEAEELVALARDHSTILQVGHIERFNPALSALDGMRMSPKYINAERLSTYTFRSTDIGVVLDLMIHDIDLVLSLVDAPIRSVAAVGVSVFGGHEDIANARIEFEDGCVANLTASRASFQATRKMRLYGPEGYASLDFATRQGTLIRPSESLRRGVLDLDGVDMTQPSAIKDQVFGKILRVDQVLTTGRDQLEQELENFVDTARGKSKPRVSGDDALRAMKLADQILKSLNAHKWEADVPNPLEPSTIAQSGHTFRGPLSWRMQGNRSTTSPSTGS